MKREASPLMKREKPTPGLDFSGLSLAFIERTGNRWFSWIGFAFHERTRADLADYFALIERTNFGCRQHCLAGACSLILLAPAVAVRQ
jgi:hypothetical protein